MCVLILLKMVKHTSKYEVESCVVSYFGWYIVSVDLEKWNYFHPRSRDLGLLPSLATSLYPLLQAL